MEGASPVALTAPYGSPASILKSIRDETHGVREELREGLRRTGERIDDLRAEVLRRQAETEIRVATEIVGVTGAVRELRDAFQEDRALRDRVDDHERRLSAVERGGR